MAVFAIDDYGYAVLNWSAGEKIQYSNTSSLHNSEENVKSVSRMDINLKSEI